MGSGAGRRARNDQRQVKTGIQVFAVPYKLRLMNVYITDVALKKLFISIIRWFLYSETNGGHAVYSPYATDELRVRQTDIIRVESPVEEIGRAHV